MGVRTLTVGFLGCGTVGAATLRLLDEHAEDIAERAGCRIEVARVGVRDPGRERDVPVPADRFTGDLRSVVDDPEVEALVEVMGGVDPALDLILRALGKGKHVVTANKELLASSGRDLFAAAESAGVDLRFEAAVGGGIPLIRPLKESLAGERVARVTGIVNGTTNFVLTRMHEDGMSFDEALELAIEQGFAEPDPTADVEGHDAAAKCAILASIAFNSRVVADDVAREGVGGVSREDVTFAEQLGYVVKPLAVAELDGDDVAVRVHPAMLPEDHPLAAVRESFNAVFVEGPNVGELMFYGRGAGGEPTAVAVVGDLVDVARSGGRPVGCTCYRERRILSIEESEGQFYLLLAVVDRPGVLARIAGVFGEQGVSIRSVWQEGTGEQALIVMITHRANEGALRRTVEGLRALDVVHEVRSVLRVEGEG
ncbi:MAG TPA: homoserine dehydrogenase [Actinomycetota bacterium]